MDRKFIQKLKIAETNFSGQNFELKKQLFSSIFLGKFGWEAIEFRSAIAQLIGIDRLAIDN